MKNVILGVKTGEFLLLLENV